MNGPSSNRFELAAAAALFSREFRAALINRYLQIFCALGLIGGIAAAVFTEDVNAISSFQLQIALYFVSLFALLGGVGSAQAERDEWQLLFTQPLPRLAYVIGKFFALLSIFGAVLTLLFVPSLFVGAAVHTAGSMWGQTVMLAAAFLALGLAAGYFAHDRAHALIVGISVWLLLLAGVDLIALFAARWTAVQNLPDLWVALLMLNPLDAFRIEVLFALQQIPAEAANKTPLTSWWIAHANFWFNTVAAIWSAGCIGLAWRRVNLWEG